jgi:hypothetical protein
VEPVIALTVIVILAALVILSLGMIREEADMTVSAFRINTFGMASLAGACPVKLPHRIQIHFLPIIPATIKIDTANG